MGIFQNKFKVIKYKVIGYDVAVGSEGPNFNIQKIEIAMKQAFSIWMAYSPIRFEEVNDNNFDISIEFINESSTTLELGTTEFLNTIKINTTNRHFIDRDNEAPYLPPMLLGSLGPYDLIGILAHEIGHSLGIDHPPLVNNIETPPGALMSRSGMESVKRQLAKYDVEQLQTIHGSVKGISKVSTDLVLCSQLNVSGLNFIKNIPGFIQVDGPVGNIFSLYVFMPATKNRKVNAVDLKYRTHLANTIVNSVELYDGIIPLQSYFLNSSVIKGSNIPFQDWNIKLGLFDRPDIKNGILAKINIEFRQVEQFWDVGVIQINDVSADCFLAIDFSLPDIGMIRSTIFVEKQMTNE